MQRARKRKQTGVSWCPKEQSMKRMTDHPPREEEKSRMAFGDGGQTSWAEVQKRESFLANTGISPGPGRRYLGSSRYS